MHTHSHSLAALILSSVPALSEDTIAVPSGQAVTFLESVLSAPGPEGLTQRFRFLAPAIAREGGTVAPEVALDDMAFLCETFALPRLPNQGPVARQVVISLSDRPVPFGETDPEATQFFEAFRPDGAVCVWEGF